MKNQKLRKQKGPLGPLWHLFTTKTNTHLADWLRGRAEVYAYLANVADLAELESWQKEKLVADALKAKVISSVKTKETPKAKRFLASLTRKGIPAEWLLLQEIHPWAYRLINEILDNDHADVREFQKQLTRPTTVCVLENMCTMVCFEGAGFREQLSQNLWEIITHEIFPFRRCPICRTIFVMNGKQKYCDQKCAARAAGPRTEYMREYMKDRRTALREKEEQKRVVPARRREKVANGN